MDVEQHGEHAVPSDPAIDVGLFKLALGSFATGVTVATAAAQEDWHGITANAVLSASLEPPLVLLSVQQATRMQTVLRQGDNFALSILAADQSDLARYFADSSQDHTRAAFARFPHHLGVTGAPLLDGALAHVDCRVVASYPAGDHILYLGLAVFLAVAAGGNPLLYYRGALG